MVLSQELTSILANPDTLPRLDAGDLVLVVAELAELQSQIVLCREKAVQCSRTAKAVDRWLPEDETAKRLGVELKWLKRHRHTLLFSTKVHRTLWLYSEVGLEKYLRKR